MGIFSTNKREAEKINRFWMDVIFSLDGKEELMKRFTKSTLLKKEKEMRKLILENLNGVDVSNTAIASNKNNELIKQLTKVQ